jgi:hypothetical protein
MRWVWIIAGVFIAGMALCYMDFIVSALNFQQEMAYPQSGPPIVQLKYSSKYSANIRDNCILVDLRYNPKCSQKYDHVMKISFIAPLDADGNKNRLFAQDAASYAGRYRMTPGGSRLFGGVKLSEFAAGPRSLHRTSWVKFSENLILEVEVYKDTCSAQEAGPAEIEKLLGGITVKSPR